jgi:hypothetical protein
MKSLCPRETLAVVRVVVGGHHPKHNRLPDEVWLSQAERPALLLRNYEEDRNLLLLDCQQRHQMQPSSRADIFVR